MKVLICQSQPSLGVLWKNHLTRQGMDVTLVTGQTAAVSFLSNEAPQIIILDLMLEEGCALGVADYASYRQPDAKVIFVTNTTFFSDGSIFSHAANACAFVRSGTAPDDLAAMVEHYGTDRASAASV